MSGKFLTALEVAGDAEAWREAGFAVEDDAIQVGQLRMRIDAAKKGIGAWQLTDTAGPSQGNHPNGTTILDHLVVFTGDPAETTERYAADYGWPAKRVRETGKGTTQTFFTTGEIIIELVGPIPNISGTRLWGLAFTVKDLDGCAELLGDKLGRAKEAVQPGRRIATLRQESCGLTIPIAFMSE